MSPGVLSLSMTRLATSFRTEYGVHACNGVGSTVFALGTIIHLSYRYQAVPDYATQSCPRYG